MTQPADSTHAKNRLVTWTLSGLLIAILLATLTVFRPALTRLFGNQGCDPSMVLDMNEMQIKTIEQKLDRTLNVPAQGTGIAYWVAGTDTNRVFALNATAENLALIASIKDGTEASVTWADCNTEAYSLSSPQAGASDLSSLLDQSKSEITIFVPAVKGSTGFVIKGELLEKTIQSFDTPNPAESHVEISLLEVSASADGRTIRISVSILNTEDAAFTLSASDIALTDESGKALSLATSEPSLPQTVQPGDAGKILLTFSRPVSSTATLKIFSVEFTIDGY